MGTDTAPMKKTSLGHFPGSDKWEFDASVTDVFDDSDRWWATGYADGEACFYAGLHKTSKTNGSVMPHTLHVSLTIQARDDDAELVTLFADILGLETRPKAKTPTWTHSKPIVRLDATRVAELQRVVDHFDRFPLRGKKAREYEAWRELALMKIAHPPGVKISVYRSNPERVRELVEKVQSLKRYSNAA